MESSVRGHWGCWDKKMIFQLKSYWDQPVICMLKFVILQFSVKLLRSKQDLFVTLRTKHVWSVKIWTHLSVVIMMSTWKCYWSVKICSHLSVISNDVEIKTLSGVICQLLVTMSRSKRYLESSVSCHSWNWTNLWMSKTY